MPLRSGVLPYFQPREHEEALGRHRESTTGDFEVVGRDQPRGGRLSDFARPYLPDNKKFHQRLDEFGVGDKYREYKSYLPYLGEKGEFAEVGLDLVEGLASNYL